MPWWTKPKEAPAPEPEPEEGEAPDGVAGWPGWTEDEEEEGGAGEPEPGDPVEAMLQERVQGLREKLAAHGLDLSEEGDPVIRDPKRFRDWLRPLSGEARARAGAGDPPPPPEAAPEPSPAPPPAPAPPVDLWEMTPEQFRQAVREEAERITRPVLEELQATKGLVGKRYVDEATRKAADALSAVAPDYLHILDHPEFEDLYRQHLSNLPPQYLDNPQVLASTALGLVAWLDPAQMPEKKPVIDGALAQAAVSRAGIPVARPALDTSAAAVPRGADVAARGSRWLAEHRVAHVPAEEWDALDAVDRYGVHTVEEYARAKKRLGRMKAR